MFGRCVDGEAGCRCDEPFTPIVSFGLGVLVLAFEGVALPGRAELVIGVAETLDADPLITGVIDGTFVAGLAVCFGAIWTAFRGVASLGHGVDFEGVAECRGVIPFVLASAE